MKAPQCSQISISLFVHCELVLVGCCKVSLNLADDVMSHGSFSAATWSPTYIARPLEFYVAYIVSNVLSYRACRHTSICLVVSVDLPWPYRTFRSRGCTVISNNPVRKSWSNISRISHYHQLLWSTTSKTCEKLYCLIYASKWSQLASLATASRRQASARGSWMSIAAFSTSCCESPKSSSQTWYSWKTLHRLWHQGVCTWSPWSSASLRTMWIGLCCRHTRSVLITQGWDGTAWLGGEVTDTRGTYRSERVSTGQRNLRSKIAWWRPEANTTPSVWACSATPSFPMQVAERS